MALKRRHGILAAAAVAALLLAGSAPPPTAQGQQAGCPTVIVHATGMGYRPMNTVVGIEWAGTTGAAGVEMDVRWTKSLFPVLMHNSTVDATTNGTGPIANLWLGQATALLAQDYPPFKTDPAYANVHVPYGWEFMHAVAVANLDAVLDINAPPTRVEMDKLAYYINLFHWGPRTIIQANKSIIPTLRAWYPGFTYYPIESYYDQYVLSRDGEVRDGAYLHRMGAVGYTAQYPVATAPNVALWHANGLRVLTWTSDTTSTDTEANWTALTDAGIDGITTNRAPDLLKWEEARGCG